MRLIQEVPFGKQIDNARQAMTIPLMLGGGLTAAAAIALQYFLIFRSATAVAGVTVALGIGAYFLTKASLETTASSMLYHLGLISSGTGAVYKEIDA
jgi:hypothetical protein